MEAEMENQKDVDVNKVLNENLPDDFNEVELGSHRGLLAGLGDPLGKALGKGASPVGKLVGDTGDRMANFTKQGPADQKGEPYTKLGGKEQNGENPLGL